MVRIDYKLITRRTRRNVKATKRTDVLRIAVNKGLTMKKKSTKKAVKGYVVTEKENGELKIMAKNDFSCQDTFAEFAEKKTGIKRQVFVTKGKGKNKKTTAKKPARNANYVSAMKKLKATIKPYWIEAGYTAKRFNVRFSQLVNIVYGVPMQLQVHSKLVKADAIAEYTVDIDNAKTWQKQIVSIVEALEEKYGPELVQIVINKPFNE